MIAHQKTSKEELCNTMKKKKILMTVMSLALVLVVAVGGTLAYLSDKSNTVTNTFNVGNGYEDEGNHTGLWLDEKDWDGKDEEGKPAERTETGNEYGELMPGSVVEKDPTFHLTAGSTDSYVFAEVKGVNDMIKAGYVFTVSDPSGLNDPTSAFGARWKKVDGKPGFDGLYVYVVNSKALEDQVKYGVAGGTDLDALFNFVKLKSGIANEDFDKIALSNVYVRGVAVQTANLSMDNAQDVAEEVLMNAGAIDQPVEP